MIPLLLGILIIVVILLVFVIKLFLTTQRGDVSTKIDASLREQFLSFQSAMHNQLNTTQQEVARSKDLISDHTVKTISTIEQMSGTIHRIIQQQEDAQKLGQSLKDLLQAPKLRGNYGEAILEEMLERVLPRGVWERQCMIDGREQVDAIVRFKGIIIPIDAKFPRTDYQRYLEASVPEEKSRCWREYEQAVKKQIKTIQDKYVKPERGTSDFALMFIPSEAIYYETIAEKNYLGEASKLFEYAQANRVIPVSPNTFYAFLQVIVIGIQNVDIIKSAKKLQEGLATLQRSFDLFYKKYDEIGKCLEKAQEAFRVGDTHIERYKNKLDSTLELDALRDDTKSLSDQTQ